MIIPLLSKTSRRRSWEKVWCVISPHEYIRSKVNIDYETKKYTLQKKIKFKNIKNNHPKLPFFIFFYENESVKIGSESLL